MTKKKEGFSRKKAHGLVVEKQVKQNEKVVRVHYRLQVSGEWKKSYCDVAGKNVSYSFAQYSILKAHPSYIILRCEYVTNQEKQPA